MWNWSNKRVLVTGGCGFIGSHLVHALCAAGARVRVVDSLERGRIENLGEDTSRVEFFRWDLAGWAAARDSCRNCDVVFHLAGKVGGLGYYLARPWDVLRSNIAIDANVLAASVDQKVPYYFYASSGHVDTDLTYGLAKRVGEQAIMAAVTEGNPIKAAIARIYGAYGPGQDYNLGTGSAIPVFCHRAASYPEIPFTVIGDGSEVRSYCYVTDIVRGILQSVELLDRCEGVGPFDLASDVPISIERLAASIALISEKQIDIQFGKGKSPIACQMPTGPQLPNWLPQVPLQDGLRACYEDVAARLEAVYA